MIRTRAVRGCQRLRVYAVTVVRTVVGGRRVKRSKRNGHEPREKRVINMRKMLCRRVDLYRYGRTKGIYYDSRTLRVAQMTYGFHIIHIFTYINLCMYTCVCNTCACTYDKVVRVLTRIELHFADHYPLVGEVKLDFHVLAHVIMQLYVDVSGVFQNRIRHVRVPNRPAVIMYSAHAELHSRFGENLQHIVEFRKTGDR